MRYLVTISYDGSNFYGFQRLNDRNTVQETIEKELSQKKYILNSKKIAGKTSQSAMVIIENGTGKVVGLVGGSGEKTDVRGFNRATQATRQTGSAGKPVAVLVPAIDQGLVTPITKIVDEETTFDDGSEEGYKPKDYNKYRGEITVRQAVESSQNIPFVKMMEMITPKVSIKYMKKMGITTLTKVDENINLALGGLDKGISPYQLAIAYTTIANDGVYIEPTFYIKVENSNGKTIVKPTQKKKRIYSKDVAYVVKSLLEEPVNGQMGTARYCKIDGIDVAAKTGTTNDEYDRWLCGFTPYYTATTWFGFDMNETIYYNGKNPSGQIWASVMKQIHKGKDKSSFEIPNDVEIVKICSTSHMPATSGCKTTYNEYFAKGTIPSVNCDKHKGSSSVTTTNNTKTNTTEETKTNTRVENITSKIENTIDNSHVIENTITEIEENITNIEIPTEQTNENTVVEIPENTPTNDNVEGSDNSEAQTNQDTSNSSDVDDGFEQ